MKKIATTFLIISSLVVSPALKADTYADDTDNDTQPEQYQEQYQDDQNDTSDEGTPVSQASNDGSNAVKKKRWQNIALAAGAIVVAVTAMILVANNDGHKKK